MDDTDPSFAFRGWDDRAGAEKGGGGIALAVNFEVCGVVNSFALPFSFETEEVLSTRDVDFDDAFIFPIILVAGMVIVCFRGTEEGFSFAIKGEVDGVKCGTDVFAEIVAESDTRSSVVARRVFRGVDPEAAAIDLEMRSCDALYYNEFSKHLQIKHESTPLHRLDCCPALRSGPLTIRL